MSRGPTCLIVTAQFKFRFLLFPLLAMKALIISVTASNPTLKEIYGLDRQMNFHRSRDSGESWRQITADYLNVVRKETKLIQASALPENLVSGFPTANLTVVANSTGTIWGGECIKVLLNLVPRVIPAPLPPQKVLWAGIERPWGRG